MANTRSAEKQQRQAEKARTRNRAGISRLRGALKKTRAGIETGEDAAKAEILSTSFSEIDKAAKKKIIRKNTADRYKSRLAAAVKRTSAK
ncbi:MAG TPA: 30S ribosomal protein S20 [Thermoanaerobaculia bacterium]|nr:30S ribosomal protein S20 [Thermoanaerobaculia bacterium]